MVSLQSRLGISSPFYGPLFSDNVEASPATLRIADTFRLRGVECEYAFRMKHALTPTRNDYTEQEVLEAVADVCAHSMCAMA
jgi:2-keto-4-pentenoate hydratase